MMPIIIAAALYLAASPANADYEASVGNYGACLGQTFAQARREKLSLTAFQALLNQRCVEEERALDRAAVQTLVSRRGMSESEAGKKVADDKAWLRARLLETFRQP